MNIPHQFVSGGSVNEEHHQFTRQQFQGLLVRKPPRTGAQIWTAAEWLNQGTGQHKNLWQNDHRNSIVKISITRT